MTALLSAATVADATICFGDFTAVDRVSLSVERGEIEVHYQPVLDLDSGRVCGLEALARWRRPGFGVLPAAEFIAVAEARGLMRDLGSRVRRLALRDYAVWSRDERFQCAPRGAMPWLGVNVSPRELAVDDFAFTTE